MKHKVTLVTGGARSGKSAFALNLTDNYSDRAFLATAMAFDEEMSEKIQRHREERGDRFETFEEPLEIARFLLSIPKNIEILIIDCLTVWLGNLMHEYPEIKGDHRQVKEFCKILATPPCDLVIVTNEVGLGIVPSNSLSRRFRDQAGFLNQKMASLADEVYLIVSGIPVKIK